MFALSERFGAAALCVDRAILHCQNSQPRLVDRRVSGPQSDVRAELHLYLDKTLRRILRSDSLGSLSFRLRKNNSPRMIAAFACLATALLVHYSLTPLVLFLGAHYLFVLFRRRGYRWSELFASAAVSLAILITWLGWSFYEYGWKDTLGSNTTVTGSQEYSLVGNLRKIVENTFKTVVPFPLRGLYESDSSYDPQVPPRGLTFLRDWFFCIYQTSFPAMLGLGGMILVAWLLGKLCLHPPSDRWQHRYGFWFWLFAVVAFVGIALVGSVEFFGIAHICLQPLVLLGLTYAAVGLPHVPLPVRHIVVGSIDRRNARNRAAHSFATQRF